MKTLKIGFIGAGNMATAIIRGMIGKGGYQPESIFAYDLNPLQLEKIGELGVQAMASAVEIVKRCCFFGGKASKLRRGFNRNSSGGCTGEDFRHHCSGHFHRIYYEYSGNTLSSGESDA